MIVKKKLLLSRITVKKLLSGQYETVPIVKLTVVEMTAAHSQPTLHRTINEADSFQNVAAVAFQKVALCRLDSLCKQEVVLKSFPG